MTQLLWAFTVSIGLVVVGLVAVVLASRNVAQQQCGWVYPLALPLGVFGAVSTGLAMLMLELV